MNKGPGPFEEDTDFPTGDRNFPPDVSHPTESDRAKWDREGESPFPREPYSRYFCVHCLILLSVFCYWLL